MKDPVSSVNVSVNRSNRIRLIKPDDHVGAVIKVIGVGGAGGNAVDNMIEGQTAAVQFMAANTDLQALDATLAPIKLQIGTELTGGLGAGASPDIGRRSAEENHAEIRDHLAGADMVFITAGMGGGTGTGAAPVIAKIANELGCLTVAVITKPFGFEGKRRQTQAEEGLRALRSAVDSVITVPNERILQVVDRGTSLRDAFRVADSVLRQAVEAIANLIVAPGLINLDFADVRTVMRGTGPAVMGTGVGHGDRRAVDAAHLALASPLLEDSSIEGARGILLNVTGGSGLGLHEVENAAAIVREAAHEEAHIIFGAVTDDTFEDRLRVTVIATGFGHRESDRWPAARDGRDQQGADSEQGRTRRFNRTSGIAYPRGESDDRDLDVPAFTRRRSR